MTSRDSEGTPWSEFLEEATSRLRAASIDEPELSARSIVEECAGLSGAEFHLGLDQLATVSGVAKFDRLLTRRLSGEPIQYVIGHWDFRYLDLMVDERVLIPRPETETVAQLAIDELGRLASESELIVADLGGGSGAIGLSIAYEATVDQVWITDVSEGAVSVIRANLAGLGHKGSKVSVSAGSWFEALPEELVGRFGVIVSNPPYVAPEDELPDVVANWEPELALRAKNGGLSDLAELVDGAGRWLRPDGSLVLEMAPTQTEKMAERASRHFAEVEIRSDLVGRDRSVVARFPIEPS